VVGFSSHTNCAKTVKMRIFHGKKVFQVCFQKAEKVRAKSEKAVDGLHKNA
jgi:hypothetical protein